MCKLIIGVCVSVHHPYFELCTLCARPTSQLDLLISKSEIREANAGCGYTALDHVLYVLLNEFKLCYPVIYHCENPLAVMGISSLDRSVTYSGTGLYFQF